MHAVSRNLPKQVAGLGMILLSIFLLSGCSGAKSGDCKLSIQTRNFSLCLPESWEEVSREMLEAREVPEETIAVFRLKDKRGGQRDNIVVSREELIGKASSLEYANANIKTITSTPSYELIDKFDVTIDKKDALIHVFSSKPVPDVPVRRFYQLSITKDLKGFTFTGTLPYSVSGDTENEIITILESVSLDVEEEEE